MVKSRMVALYLAAAALCALSFGIGCATKSEALKKRSVSLAALITLLFGCVACGSRVIFAVSALLAVLGVIEIMGCFPKGRFFPIYFIAASAMAGAVFVLHICFRGSGRESVILEVSLILHILMTLTVFFGKMKWVDSEAGAVLFSAYPTAFGCACVYLIGQISWKYLLMIMCAAVMNDAAAYFSGRFLGKHHPFPKISPGKSTEGYLGGLIGVSLGVCLCIATLRPEAVTFERMAVFILLAWVTSGAGDLLFSQWKRRHGKKDFSRLMGAHGGVLDRFDDIIWMQPIFLFVLMRFGL